VGALVWAHAVMRHHVTTQLVWFAELLLAHLALVDAQLGVPVSMLHKLVLPCVNTRNTESDIML
jgi:hypothetical protein